MADLGVEKHGNVATVLLARNALNTLSPDLVDELAGSLGGLAQDPGVDAVVLGSASDKFFSAGWDLPLLQELGRPAMQSFLAAFDRLTIELCCLRVATVAAVDGFAVAGGFILALACDYRVMTSNAKRRIGLTEVDLGLPLPLPAALLLQHVAGGRAARDLAVAGRLLAPADALASGCVDALADEGNVLDAALEIARELAAKPSHAVGRMKQLLHEPLVQRVADEGARHQESFLDTWMHPDTRPMITEAARKLVPR